MVRSPLSIVYSVCAVLGAILLVLGILSKAGVYTLGNGPAELSLGIVLLIVAAVVYFVSGYRRGPRNPV